MSMIDCLKKLKKKVDALRQTTAKEYVPKMYHALRNETLNLTPEDARGRIENDCRGIWKKRTILEFLPDEAKDPEKQESGRLGKKKHNSAAVTAAPLAKKKEIMIDTDGNTIENGSVLTTTSFRSTIDDPRIPPFVSDNQLPFEFCIPSRYVLEHLFLDENKVDQICLNGVLDKHTGEVISYSIKTYPND